MARRDARMDEVLEAIANMGNALERQVQDNGGQIERFLKLNPPQFEGLGESEEAEIWIDNMEKIFALLNSTDVEKLTYAEYQMEGNAKHWWRATKVKVFPEGTEIVWATFVQTFYEKYSSNTVKNKKMSEFVQLTQQDLTVDQYEAKFAELSRFAPRLIEHEEDKIKKFLNGLKNDFRKQLVPFNLKDYNEVYERAQLVEQDLNREVTEKKDGDQRRSNEFNKRKGSWKKPYNGPSKKRYFGNFQRGNESRYNQGGSRPQWNTPRRPPPRCFTCGQVGHFRRECPRGTTFVGNRQAQSSQQSNNVGQGPKPAQRPPAQGRVYAVTREAAEASKTVISSTLSVCGKKAYVLFDTGATHSFISSQFVELHGLESAKLSEPLVVSTPLNVLTLSTQMCEACEISINGHSLLADLTVLPMYDFDVIFGMDW